MKQVFNSGEIAHEWFHQYQDSGRTSGNKMSFDGIDFYSYSTIVAKKFESDGKVLCLISRKRYSNTTTGHMKYVEAAIPRGTKKVYYDGDVSSFWHCDNPTSNCHLDLIQDSLDWIWSLVLKQKRAKLEDYWGRISVVVDGLIDWVEFWGLSKGYVYSHFCTTRQRKLFMRAILTGNDWRAKSWYMWKEIAGTLELEWKERLAKARQVSIDEKKSKEALVKSWLDGNIDTDRLMSSRFNFDTVFLRVQNDRIETSKGISVPVSDKVKILFETVYSLHNNEVKDVYSRRLLSMSIKDVNGREWSIGQVHDDGGFVSGCHDVPYNSIEAVGKQLNWV